MSTKSKYSIKIDKSHIVFSGFIYFCILLLGSIGNLILFLFNGNIFSELQINVISEIVIIFIIYLIITILFFINLRTGKIIFSKISFSVCILYFSSRLLPPIFLYFLQFRGIPFIDSYMEKKDELKISFDFMGFAIIVFSILALFLISRKNPEKNEKKS